MYSRQIGREDYFAAKKSLAELVPNLKNKTFLDIGSGSGLFSIAAGALGAKNVLGFDYDSESVATSKALLEKVAEWDSDVKKKNIKFEKGSILENIEAYGRYDIVYSWGVLHHTGDMYKAFENTAAIVNEKGLLVIAIYNRHLTSPIWKIIKYIYVKSPALLQKLLVLVVTTAKLITSMLTGHNPLKKSRGMRFYSDIVDWVGGYPYEYASIQEICAYFESRGFKTMNVIKTTGFTGCNQFVFERVA